MHLAFASTDGRVGYMDSRADGERLRAWWAWGSGPEDLSYVDMTDELYELTGADALFATSGGTVAHDGAVALPYVVRTGNETHVRVVYARGGRLVGAAQPLVGDGGVLLDETTLGVWDGRLVANCRIQGFEGRGSGARLGGRVPLGSGGPRLQRAHDRGSVRASRAARRARGW